MTLRTFGKCCHSFLDSYFSDCSDCSVDTIKFCMESYKRDREIERKPEEIERLPEEDLKTVSKEYSNY